MARLARPSDTTRTGDGCWRVALSDEDMVGLKERRQSQLAGEAKQVATA